MKAPITTGAPFKSLTVLLSAFVTLNFSPPSLAQTNLINVTNIGTLSGNFGAAAVVDHYVYYAAPGLQIFDISNPTAPVLCYSDPPPSVATDVQVDGNRAYVVYNDGPLYIFDISNRTNPVAMGYVTGCWGTVAVSGRLAFLGPCGGTFPVGAYDISNPANPVSLNSQLYFWPSRMVSSGNYIYIIDGSLNVIDASNATNLIQVGTTPKCFAVDAAISGNYAYLACWTNWFNIYNISNPSNPVPVYKSFDDTYGSVALSGNYAYLIGSDKLAVYDVSDPTNATRVASVNVAQGFECCDQHGFVVSKGYAYAYYGLSQSIYSLAESSPALSLVSANNNNLLLSWPTPAAEFAIQQNPGLNPSHWTTLTNASIVVGSQNQVTVPTPQGTMFYRLISQ